MRKPRPAPIYEKLYGRYRLHFSYHRKQYRRYYIRDQREAYILQEDVNHLVGCFKNGKAKLPPNMSLPDFIFDSVMGRLRETPEISVVRLSTMMVDYLRLSAPPAKAQSTYKTEQIHLSHLKRFADQQKPQDPALCDINIGFFDRYKQFRYDQKVRTDTVNKELGTFQCMFQMAMDHGYLKTNVIKDVKRDKSQAPCERFHTHDEVQKLLENAQYDHDEIKELQRFQYLTMAEIKELLALASGKWLYPILVVFAYTGMRRGELARLAWADVDLEQQYLYVRSRKQSKQQKETVRQIPIHACLLPVLQDQKLKTGNDRWVFLGPEGGQIKTCTLRETLHRLLQGTKFEGVGFHVLRHSFASNLAALGVKQDCIDAFLGHQTEAMRRRYKHLFPDNLGEAVSKLGML